MSQEILERSNVDYIEYLQHNAEERHHALVLRQKAREEHKEFIGAFDELGIRVPKRNSDEMRFINQNADGFVKKNLDEFLLLVDTYKEAARFGALLYKRVIGYSGFSDYKTEHHPGFSICSETVIKGQQDFDQSLRSLDYIRGAIPRSIDPDNERASHPSAFLTPAGVVGLSYLARSYNGFRSIEEAAKMRAKAVKMLTNHDSYALNLYLMNQSIFDGRDWQTATYPVPLGNGHKK